ncbi:TolB family protein [Breznakibacter xylanolyticus]|nr:PD40 domain-containing protein [Breznakibacter xylanolyticus]
MMGQRFVVRVRCGAILCRLFCGMIMGGMGLYGCTPSLPKAQQVTRMALLEPVLHGIALPVNIAPLNFVIQEKGVDYRVAFRGKQGDAVVVSDADGIIRIPLKSWKNLLMKNRDDSVSVNVYVRDDSRGWLQFQTARFFVSSDSIDPYVVYRNIGSNNILWSAMSIEQQSLEDGSMTVIADNKLTRRNCMNCHSFNQNNPEQMLLHLRTPPGGTMVKQGDQLSFFNTQTQSTISAGTYPAWHPSGRFIAFSVNQIHQRFFLQTRKYEVVEDKMSDIVLLDIDTQSMLKSPVLSTDNRENLPSWSPDGKFLYYVLGNPYCESDYRENRYNLMRVAFDENTGLFGAPDTLLHAAAMGKSVSFPDVSPDGQWLLFCMADYGYFTVYNTESDIYLMNLRTRDYHRLDVNSVFVESYPTWSSNGKWLMFVSKRRDNMFSRPWFAHFREGVVSSPFVLPQKDPLFYETCLRNFNRPEFVTGKVNLMPSQVAQLASQKPLDCKVEAPIHVDGVSGASRVMP